MANLKGEKAVFSYIKDPPRQTTKAVPADPTIQMHNLKSKNKPFIIFEPGDRMGSFRDMNIENLAKPGSCNHWPEGLIPCDGRTGRTTDRADELPRIPDQLSGPPPGRNAREDLFPLRHDGCAVR